MNIATIYLRSDITIESEIIGAKKFYVYNDQGIYYRVFDSLIKLGKFIKGGCVTWIFECEAENELEKYLDDLG